MTVLVVTMPAETLMPLTLMTVTMMSVTQVAFRVCVEQEFPLALSSNP